MLDRTNTLHCEHCGKEFVPRRWGLLPRLCSSGCQWRAYYAANKEEIAAWNRAYRASNREKIAARRHAHYIANKEKISVRSRAKSQEQRELAAIGRKALKIIGEHK